MTFMLKLHLVYVSPYDDVENVNHNIIPTNQRFIISYGKREDRGEEVQIRNEKVKS